MTEIRSLVAGSRGSIGELTQKRHKVAFWSNGNVLNHEGHGNYITIFI